MSGKKATGASESTYSQKQLQTLVARRHPRYKELLPHWTFMRNTYDGGRDWFKANTFRYIKEGEREFEDRLSRTYRFNHTREVVDLINKYLFKQNISRNEEDAPDYLVQFWRHATKNGLSIKDLARQISKKTSQQGRIGVVVDRTHQAENIISVADEKRAGVKTYAYLLDPQQLLDYSYDEDGALNWVLVHEIARDDQDPIGSSGNLINRFRLWTKDDWTLFEEKGGREIAKKQIQIIDSNQHGLGEVPVILADNIVGHDEYSAPALIDDIAYLDRAVANYLSNLDAIIQDQTFSQLAMPAQNVIAGEDKYNAMLEMGTKRIFLYDGEGGSAPMYLSPDVKQAELILSAINKIIGEIYHTVGMAGERTNQDNAVGIDNSSGVAKAYDFERVNALLVAKADSLEWIENRISRLVAKWNGEELPDGSALVSYPDNFDTRGLYDEFDISARLMLVEAPDAIRRQQMEMLLDKLFPQLAKDLRQKMLSELKDWPLNLDEMAMGASDTSGAVSLDAASKDKTADKAKNPESGDKATRNNRQGQVTKDTK